MSGLARRLHWRPDGRPDWRPRLGRPGGAVAFAVKVIGIGLFAGLTLVYCQFLLDACFRGLH